MENRDRKSAKAFNPGLYRAENGHIYIADLHNDIEARPAYLIDYTKLIYTLQKESGKEKVLNSVQERLLGALTGVTADEKPSPDALYILPLVEDFADAAGDLSDMRAEIKSCIVEDENLIDEYMAAMDDHIGNPVVKLFRFHRGMLADSLETTIQVKSLYDIQRAVEYAMSEIDPKNIRILNDPICDPRLPSEWGGICYYVLADIKGHFGQCVGMSNFYDTEP